MITFSNNLKINNLDEKIRFLKGVFQILLIATIISIFEIFFYIFIVKPTLLIAVNGLLIGIIQEPQSELEIPIKILDILIDNESKLSDDINMGSYMFIVIEILLLIAILCYVYLKILQLSRRKQDINIENDISNDNNLISTILSATIVTIILMGFQVFFFFFGRNFYYMGKYGIIEIESHFITNLKKHYNII
jgi:hypothetical protein